MAFLRGVPCGDTSCMNLHEWGDEKDCFTKEDLTTLYDTHPCRLFDLYLPIISRKHTMKATESRARLVASSKKSDESERKYSLALLHQGVSC